MTITTAPTGNATDEFGGTVTVSALLVSLTCPPASVSASVTGEVVEFCGSVVMRVQRSVYADSVPVMLPHVAVPTPVTTTVTFPAARVRVSVFVPKSHDAAVIVWP